MTEIRMSVCHFNGEAIPLGVNLYRLGRARKQILDQKPVVNCNFERCSNDRLKRY